MKTKQILLSTIVIMTFLITACGGSTPPTEEVMPHTDATEVMMGKETPTADAMMNKETPTTDAAMNKETPAADAMMESPAWSSKMRENQLTPQRPRLQGGPLTATTVGSTGSSLSMRKSL